MKDKLVLKEKECRTRWENQGNRRTLLYLLSESPNCPLFSTFIESNLSAVINIFILRKIATLRFLVIPHKFITTEFVNHLLQCVDDDEVPLRSFLF